MNMLASSSSTTSSMSVLLPTTSKPLFSIRPNNVHMNKLKMKTNRFTVSAVVAEDAAAVSLQPPPQSQKLGVVVKPTDKPRLVLKFIWMEKNIGIGLDQMIPGHGTIPLSPYYFWPRKDAWEELKELLESKPWISQKQMIILLNQATDIINLWQQSGGNLSS
ncbi:putative ribosomal protein PSRP-3/Ycf65 [Medicago truncatula]|uniref:Plastid-specific 30S ribosomal protein, putative n=1 Tax=Medicago truncatula TaxID=3880 RepID=B7FMM7_MEDTR|nr:30S ribosomal protein 3, chloroplastic [Medicago truncatula]ACJ86010.1 unknown [Medicago truncatula]AES77010.1 plastid-specific 30S ribosomal protein, putative [Medicago truncatula]AFK33825.1 unknown [Medicago truncatula]RHN53054.1 putative ribosomal protein PSRP-3/Ycf65 [Medicago truncatula]